MPFHIGDDGQALASVVMSLGGTIQSDETFSFPVEKLTEAVPKLQQLGIGVTKVRDYTELHPDKFCQSRSVAVFTAHKVQDDKPTRLKTRGYGSP
jgi:hypothetical protein